MMRWTLQVLENIAPNAKLKPRQSTQISICKNSTSYISAHILAKCNKEVKHTVQKADMACTGAVPPDMPDRMTYK